MTWRNILPDELSPGEIRAVEVEGVQLVVGRTEQGYFAVQDECSHEKLPLSHADGIPGRVERGLLVCPHHGAKYDPHTGRPKGLPAIRPVKTFQVKLEEGAVWVEIEA